MAEPILVTGKRISDMELVTVVVGTEKIPTGQAGDLAITPNQISDHTIIRGDLVSQEDLSQVEVSLGTQISEEEAARIAADDLKVDKEGSVFSVAGRVGDVVLSPSDVLVGGFGSQEYVNKYVPKPFLSGHTYGLGERVVLNDGEVVKSLIDGNAVNPNVGMTGWVSAISDSLSDTIQTFKTPEAGIDTVTGVADGAYFNVQSSSDESYIDEYRNVGGSAVATGKRYLSSLGVQLQEKAASTIKDVSGKNQQEINNLLRASNFITPREFGGKPDDPEFDNKYALQACSDSKLPILLDGFYYTTESPVFGTRSTIKGIGAESSGIIKVGNNASDTESLLVREGVIDNYQVDAILIIKGKDRAIDGSVFAAYVDLDSFSLRRYQCSPLVGVCYGLFAPRLSLSRIANIAISNTLDGVDGSAGRVGYAVRVVQGWMLSWDRIDATGDYSFHFGTDTDGHGYTSGGGTSNTFTSCWAAGTGSSAWYFYGYQYSNLISCGADYTGLKAPEKSFVFNFRTSVMGLINCSAEQVHGRLINANDSSYITVINPHFYHGIYGSGTLDALVRASGNSRLNIIGGQIHPQSDATNPPYQSQINSILRTQDVVENFTFNVSKTQNVTDKTQVSVSLNSEFIHENGGVKRCWASDTLVLEPSYDENGYKTKGSIELTSSKSTVKLTSFDAFKYTDPMQLGRMRVWWGAINNAAGLYYKIGDDPESETDGTLLNALRGVGSEWPVTRITGQHFIRSDLNKPFWWNGAGWFDALGNGASTAKPTIQGLKTPTTLAEQVVVNDSIVAALVTLGLVVDSRT